MFKHQAIFFQKPLQRGRAVIVTPGKQDQIMGAGDGSDAIDLNETQLSDQPRKISPFARPGRRAAQGMAVQKKATGKGV
jgi:hypothetical protein